MLCYVFRPLFRTNRIIGIRILWGENSLVRLGLISVFFIVLLITFLVTFPPTGVQPSWHPLYTIFPGQHKNGESAQEMTQVADLWDSPPVRSSSHLRFLTIVTLFKDERPRLREWIEFNIGTGGVDHFVLYDHGSTDEPLEILQYYINEGKVTYIPWPPQSIPPPPPFNTRLEESQYSIFKDNLEACIDKTDTVHKQASCQKSAVSHCAIYHGKGGGTRWLAFLDVDEFLFPRPMSKYKSVAEILRQQYPGTDHLIIVGINFGPSEHINHAARPAPGSPLPALIIESYTRRPELGSDIWNSQWASSITKAIANPDMISHSEIHRFVPPDNTNWSEETVTLHDEALKFNHYPILSHADLLHKAEKNGNPSLLGFDDKTAAFYSREKDTEIHYYIPELKERMLCAVKLHPPLHPDDWSPQPDAQ